MGRLVSRSVLFSSLLIDKQKRGVLEHGICHCTEFVHGERCILCGHRYVVPREEDKGENGQGREVLMYHVHSGSGGVYLKGGEKCEAFAVVLSSPFLAELPGSFLRSCISKKPCCGMTGRLTLPK